ncbi:excalibur calcium-binding domain-containing protein [Ectobacillus polymachus]|uniref:excalibur calcium-binding domain-containing protein n=1 Tax=Ectobacillus polymachus TaxID=1508806 RepID=UPI003A8BDCC3
MKHWLILGALSILIISLVGCNQEASALQKETKQQQPTQEAKTEKPATYEIDGISITKPSVKNADVIGVVDGDTITVKIDDKEEKVRFTLVDTPETKNPSTPVEPWGPEASDFTTQQLLGKQVGLEFDSQERDQYGRLLAYVWIGNELFNGTLLDKGFARVAVYPPNTKYENQLKTIQDHSKNGKSGIWSIENYVTDSGFNMDAVKPKEQPAPAPIPAPSSQPEQKTAQNDNVFYANCTEARKAGATNIKKGEPGYAPKLDRDGDGIACEDSDFESNSSHSSQPASQPQQSQDNVFYANCTAVRKAGKAPLHKGDPGYSSKLDRDGDGIACE